MHKLKVVRNLRGVRKSQHTIENKIIASLIKLIEEMNIIAYSRTHEPEKTLADCEVSVKNQHSLTKHSEAEPLTKTRSPD
jgi:hypothetical protein